MAIKQTECRSNGPVGARFIAPLVPVEVRFANGLRGAINLAPTEAARFAAAHNATLTGESPEDGKGVR